MKTPHKSHPVPAATAKPGAKAIANSIASDFVYGIYSWRGHSPAFMQAQVRKLESAILQRLGLGEGAK